MKKHKDKNETKGSALTADLVDCVGDIKKEIKEETLDDGLFTIKEEPVYTDVTPNIMKVKVEIKEEETLDNNYLCIKEEPAQNVIVKEEETGDYTSEN